MLGKETVLIGCGTQLNFSLSPSRTQLNFNLSPSPCVHQVI